MILCYDLSKSPPQFDALAFAIYGNSVRKVQRWGDLRVVVSPGARPTHPDAGQTYHGLLERVCVPILRMMPAEVEVLDKPPKPDTWGYGFRGHGMDKLMEGLRFGGRSLRPRQELPRDDKLVTITLRESYHWPTRNSNTDQWIAAALQITQLGYRVVFIRDTFRADEEFPWVTRWRAAVDLDYRGALYRSAFMNFGVSNGPTWFGMMIDAPMFIFKPTVEGVDWAYTRAFFREHGVRDQYPDCPPYQRIFWEDDTAPAIVKGFKEYVSGSQSAGGALHAQG